MKLVQYERCKETYCTVCILIFQFCREGCKGRLERVFGEHLFKVSYGLQRLGLNVRILTLDRIEKSGFSLFQAFSL